MIQMKDGIQAIMQKINIDSQQHSIDCFEQRKNSIDNEIDGENTDYINDLSKRRVMLIKNNDHDYARMLERMLSRLHREILTYQHDLINEIFNMAVAKLRTVSREEFADMLKTAVKGLNGSFTLYLGELSGGMIGAAEIENAVKDNNTVKIELSGDTIPEKSGFVLRDDRVEYNCLFEDMMEDKKNSHTAEILKEVFGDAETRLAL